MEEESCAGKPSSMAFSAESKPACTDPAEKEAGSICPSLTLLSPSCLWTGWNSPLVNPTGSQQRALEFTDLVHTGQPLRLQSRVEKGGEFIGGAQHRTSSECEFSISSNASYISYAGKLQIVG